MSTITKLTSTQVNAALKRLSAFADATPARDIIALFQGEAWKATGHANWVTFCADRMSGLKFTTIARRTMLPELIEAKMSQRAIAVAVNVKQPQIAQDLAAIRALAGNDDAPENDNDSADENAENGESTPRAAKTDAQKAGEALAKALKLITALGTDVPDSIREAVHELDALVNVRVKLATVTEVTPDVAASVKPAKVAPVKRARARKAA